MTENQKLREVATELDRLMLVIESAVRHADPRNHASVMALIAANKEALALPTAALAVPQGEPVNELVRLCPDIECARKKKCTRIPGISCMSRAKENY